MKRKAVVIVAVLAAGAALVGAGVKPEASIEFLGVTWSRPQPYTPTLMRAWQYTNPKYPNVRVIEQRTLEGEPHTRWTEARKDDNSEWVQHGAEVAYVEGQIQVIQTCNGDYVAAARSTLPLQDQDNQPCEFAK